MIMETERKIGHLHPLTIAQRDVELIMRGLGFDIAFGPELESEHYNFDVLNMPADHPSRDMQDTLWLKPEHRTKEFQILRTHLSGVQVREMEKRTMPTRVTVLYGRVFRNEATDASHEANYYQMEALYVDKKVTLADLKGTLTYFCKKFFNDDNVKIRFRPSYFPFVEPALEVDMWWKDRWLEIAGSGLVHPNVLRAAGVDPEVWTGYAFSFGIDRLMMLRHGVPDIRLSYTGDLRFVQQF